MSVLLAAATAVLSCKGGCRAQRDTAQPVGGALAAFPAETRVVLSIDVARARKSPLWTELSSLAATAPGDRKQIEEFASRTGFDPLTDLDSIVVAFPEEARRGGEMGLVLRGRNLEEPRLIAYAGDHLRKSGDDLFSVRRGDHTLWASRRQPTTAWFFAGSQTFVLGAGGWAEKIADLIDGAGPSGAESQLDLVHLVERADPRRTVWAAAIVPAATRAELAADPAFASAAGVARLAVGLDLDSGLDARLIADLATRAQAEELQHRVETAVQAAKKSPQVLMLGVGPYLDGISARAVDASCEIKMKLEKSQVADLFSRLRAYLQLARQGSVPGFPRP